MQGRYCMARHGWPRSDLKKRSLDRACDKPRATGERNISLNVTPMHNRREFAQPCNYCGIAAMEKSGRSFSAMKLCWIGNRTRSTMISRLYRTNENYRFEFYILLLVD